MATEKVVLVIHGGCGGIRINAEQEVIYRTALLESLQGGYDVLKSGGTSMEAVVACISYMEDNPLFNAGCGAALNNRGFAELDASVMDGKTLNAGAVAAVTNIKNPIVAAQRVLEKSPHLFLAGPGAHAFAEHRKLKLVEPEYFITEKRVKQLKRIRAKHKMKITLDHGESSLMRQMSGGEMSDYEVKPKFFVHQEAPLPTEVDGDPTVLQRMTEKAEAEAQAQESGKNKAADRKAKEAAAADIDESKLGTVGCVALDLDGNLAAGTSTGGLVNQQYGRVADTPMIGSGVYANNKTCAVSSTGTGEYFIKLVAAYDISCLMEYANMNVADAAKRVVNKKLVAMRGRGGVICLDSQGNMAYPFNTRGMYRGYVTEGGHFTVNIYKDHDDRETTYNEELAHILAQGEEHAQDSEEEVMESSEI